MSKVIMTRGLPASGKSTWAKSQIKKGKVIRVNKDDLRAMLHNGEWSKGNEKEVLQFRDMIVVNALVNGKTIIIDDTNFHPSHEETLRNLARMYEAEFEIKEFNTPLEECIRRDAKRDNPVGKDVILRMWNEYLKPEKPKFDPAKGHCIMCDLDGTLALFDGNPYERDFFNDRINAPVRQVVVDIVERGYKLVILSGRNAKFKKETEDWLKQIAGFNWYELHMREEKDNRPDYVVKEEMYRKYVEPYYNVRFVIDDRPQVVRLWRSLGLFVFDVNQQGIEF